LPVTVYTIAITGVLSKPDGNHYMIYFALGALLTAEIMWFIVKWANRNRPVEIISQA
jgi:hypothetical protein